MPDSTTVTTALRVRDAAKLLGIHPNTLYRLTRAGKIPHVRVGGALRFSRATLEALLAGNAPK